MSSTEFPRMSLAAQYDDLCRYSKVLTSGCEEEFKDFVESQRNAFNSLRDMKYELKKEKVRLAALEAEKRKHDIQINQIKLLIEDERKRTSKVKQEKNCLERQLALIKEVLLTDGNTIDNQTKEKILSLSSTACKESTVSTSRLPTIGESAISFLSESDMDYTMNDAALVTSNLKRHSRGNGRRSGERHHHSKRKSEERVQFLIPNEGLKMDLNPSKQEELNSHSSSEENFSSSKIPGPSIPTLGSDSEHTDGPSYVTVRTHIKKTIGPKSAPTECTTGEKQMHAFDPKRIKWPTVPCCVCREHFKFFESVLNCKNCESVCHPECEKYCMLPCAPTSNFNPARNDVASSLESLTSEMEPVPVPSILGPIQASGVRPKNVQVGSLKPRKHKRKSKGAERPSFESPIIQ